MNLSYWNRTDPELGIVQPWFTHSALDEIQSWNLSDKVVLEYGGGLSTIWWANKCKAVFTIETKQEWIDHIRLQDGFSDNINLIHRSAVSIDGYVRVPDGCRPDIVVIDGGSDESDIVPMRHACLERALTLPRPLTIIFDNWQQDFVFVSPISEKIMKPYRGEFYMQPDHTNHNGRPWQTAIWHLDV